MLEAGTCGGEARRPVPRAVAVVAVKAAADAIVGGGHDVCMWLMHVIVSHETDREKSLLCRVLLFGHRLFQLAHEDLELSAFVQENEWWWRHWLVGGWISG